MRTSWGHRNCPSFGISLRISRLGAVCRGGSSRSSELWTLDLPPPQQPAPGPQPLHPPCPGVQCRHPSIFPGDQSWSCQGHTWVSGMAPWLLSSQTSYFWPFPPHWTSGGGRLPEWGSPSPPESLGAPSRSDSAPGGDGGKGPSGASAPPSGLPPSPPQPQRRPPWGW